MKNIGEIAANFVLIGIALTPVLFALGQLAGVRSTGKSKPGQNTRN